MTSTRIYKVTHGTSVQLVSATNAAQARNHCARHQYRVEVARQHDLVQLVSAGTKVETATMVAQETADMPGGE